MHSYTLKAHLGAALLAAALLVEGCGGGNTGSGVPAVSPQSRTPKLAKKSNRVTARIALTMLPALVRLAPPRREPRETPIAEEALQIGHAYPNRESWGYSNIDPSC